MSPRARLRARAICSSPARRVTKALAVYDKIDAIKVKPDWAMARVGGEHVPEDARAVRSVGLQQWRRRQAGYRPTTSISAWSTRRGRIEEYTATYNDDDIKFVGTIERGDGPVHAERRRPESQRVGSAQQHRRRLGGREVSRRCGGGKPAPTLRARAHLLVTVPLYMGFDPTVETSDDARRHCANFIRSRPPAERFLYLVPSAAVFALDDCSAQSWIRWPPVRGPPTTLRRELAERFDRGRGLRHDRRAAARPRARRIGVAPQPMPKIIPLKPVPLQTLVVNVTNQCNLACTYCYEYGEDKIVDTENGKQPKFMSEETARESVEFALRESRDNPHAHITFFGGETLMNFNVPEVDDRLRAAARRRSPARRSTSA